MLPYPTTHGFATRTSPSHANQHGGGTARARADKAGHAHGARRTYKTSSWDSSAYQTKVPGCFLTSRREEQHASGHGEGSVTSKLSHHQDPRPRSPRRRRAAAVKPVPETTMEEERYVQVASRFFRVKPGDGGDGAVASLHYLGSCFLCKETIACNRDVFMYKYAREHI